MPRTECEKHKSKPKGPSGRWSVTSAFIKVPLLLSTLSPLVFKYLGSPNELWWEWCVWLLTRQEKGIVFFYFWRLSFITNREIRDERLVPSFDIVARIRARRLIWAGHLLREKEEHLPKRVAVARLKSDLQEHSSLRTDHRWIVPRCTRPQHIWRTGGHGTKSEILEEPCGGNWTKGHTRTAKKEEGEENKELRDHHIGSWRCSGNGWKE